jgi:hypothetical protein
MRRVTDPAANVVRDRRTSWWSNARGQMAPVDRTANIAEASVRRYPGSRNLRLSRQLIGPSRRHVLTACAGTRPLLSVLAAADPGRRGQGPKPSPGLTVRGSAWTLHSCIPRVLPGNTYGVLQGNARETRWLRTDARSAQVEMAACCYDSCTSPTGRVCLP